MRECEIYYKELANMILEADESQDPLLRGKLRGGLPGSAMAKTPRPNAGTQVRSLVRT